MAILLRKLFGQVKAYQVFPPGKSRGYIQLRFRVNGWEMLNAVLAEICPIGDPSSTLPDGQFEDGFSEELRLDLGGPSRMDRWGPKIAEMRSRGVPWKEIQQITGLGSGPAYVAWKRYVDAQQAEAAEADSADPCEEAPEAA